MQRQPLLVRFAAKVNKSTASGCWLWAGAKSRAGYGMIRDDAAGRKVLYAHRVSYEAHKGPIPAGLEIDHLCRVRHCVNPDHLEAVTSQVNSERGIAGKLARERFKAMTHCKRGHEFNATNTRTLVNGYRVCVECERVRTNAGPRRKLGDYCSKGHALTGKNSRGNRRCLTCHRDYERERIRNRKAGGLGRK